MSDDVSTTYRVTGCPISLGTQDLAPGTDVTLTIGADGDAWVTGTDDRVPARLLASLLAGGSLMPVAPDPAGGDA